MLLRLDRRSRRGRKEDPLYRVRRLPAVAATSDSVTPPTPAPEPGRRRWCRGEIHLALHPKGTLRGLCDFASPQVAGSCLGELAADLHDANFPAELRRLGRTLGRTLGR